jgi:hypothetical protein
MRLKSAERLSIVPSSLSPLSRGWRMVTWLSVMRGVGQKSTTGVPLI